MLHKKIDLQLFGDYGTSDFFENAFAEFYNEPETSYNDSMEGTSEGVGATESDSTETPDDLPTEQEETPVEVEETPTDNSESNPQLSKEELIEALRASQEPVVDEKTQQALELMEYLEQHPELIQSMRAVDAEAYQTLNTFVPDEITQKLQEFEEFMVEQQYQAVVREMTSKYPDYDADKVLEFAEEHGLTDLEIAYQTHKAMNAPKFDVEAERAKLREELKAELLKELQNDVSSTSSIVGQGADVPPTQTEIYISSAERKVAENMGMSIEDYTKWRDGK